MNSQKKGVCFAQPTMLHKSMNSLIFQENNNQSESISGNLSSNVSGNVSSNVSGNVSGNLSGNLSGNTNGFNSPNKKFVTSKNGFVTPAEMPQSVTNVELQKSIQFNNLNKNYITPNSRINAGTTVNNRQNFKFNLEQENQIKHIQFLQQLQINEKKSKNINNKMSNTIRTQKHNSNISMVKQTIR